MTHFFAALKRKIVTKSSSECHDISVFDEIQERKEMTVTYAGFADFDDEPICSNELAGHGLVFTFHAFGDSYSQSVAVLARKRPTKRTVLTQLVM